MALTLTPIEACAESYINSQVFMDKYVFKTYKYTKHTNITTRKPYVSPKRVNAE